MYPTQKQQATQKERIFLSVCVNLCGVHICGFEKEGTQRLKVRRVVRVSGGKTFTQQEGSG